MAFGYDALDGSPNVVDVSYKEPSEITIEQFIVVGTQQDIANGSGQHVLVTMTDQNADGVLDFIRYDTPDGRAHKFNSPNDEASLALWSVALAVAIEGSQCCK